MEEGKERKCGCRAACVYRTRENKRIWEDKQEMKGIWRIEQQLERMQMVSGFHIITVCGVLHFSFSAGYCMHVCVCQRGCTHTYFMLKGACSVQTQHALYCLCERSIICA